MNWSYFLVFALLACGPTRVSPYSGGANATGNQTGKNSFPPIEDEGINQTGTNTCNIPQDEKLRKDLSQGYLGLMKTKTFESQVVVRIPQKLQKYADYLDTAVKSPLKWRVTFRYGDHKLFQNIYRKFMLFSEFQKGVDQDKLPSRVYARETGNDDHLPATLPLQHTYTYTNADDITQTYYPAVAIGNFQPNSPSKGVITMTYDVIDYLSSDKCPATITGSTGSASGDNFSLNFANGNEIKILAPQAPQRYPMGGYMTTLGYIGLSFWMGRDGNLKMSYNEFIDDGKNGIIVYKLATFAECGNRIPALDYEFRRNCEFKGCG